jgi:hypothetical protein
VIAAVSTKWSDPTVFATLSLAGVAALSAIVAAWSAILTKRSVGLTADEVAATKRSVEVAAEGVAATRENVEIATRDLETAIRPVLADVPRGEFIRDVMGLGQPVGWTEDLAAITIAVYPDRPGAHCSVPMRNVGTGVAVLVETRAQMDADLSWHSGDVSVRLLPPGEIVRLSFQLPATPTDHLEVRACYTDIAGGQVTRTGLRAEKGPNGELRVVGVSLFHGDEAAPFVQSGQGVDGKLA